MFFELWPDWTFSFLDGDLHVAGARSRLKALASQHEPWRSLILHDLVIYWSYFPLKVTNARLRIHDVKILSQQWRNLTDISKRCQGKGRCLWFQTQYEGTTHHLGMRRTQRVINCVNWLIWHSVRLRHDEKRSLMKTWWRKAVFSDRKPSFGSHNRCFKGINYYSANCKCWNSIRECVMYNVSRLYTNWLSASVIPNPHSYCLLLV